MLLRIIRINSGDTSRDMAKKLGLSASYLSAIEGGKRNIPTDMEKMLSKSYPLSKIDIEKLRSAMLSSSDSVKINLTDFAEKKQRVIMAIAQDDISDNVLDEISDLIFKHETIPDGAKSIMHSAFASAELSFGFGNVCVFMREKAGFPKEEFFLGLSGTYLLNIKNNDIFRRRFSGRNGAKRLRAATLPIIKRVGAEALCKYATDSEIYLSDIRRPPSTAIRKER